jgi:hypothetical protein
MKNKPIYCLDKNVEHVNGTALSLRLKFEFIYQNTVELRYNVMKGTASPLPLSWNLHWEKVGRDERSGRGMLRRQ